MLYKISYSTTVSYIMSLPASLGQSKNGSKEAEFSSRARGNPIHGLLCQECHRGVQESQTLQEYPTSDLYLHSLSRLNHRVFFLSLLFFLLSINNTPSTSSSFPHITNDCFLTSWHPPVSCWRCASSAWRRWGPYLQTPMSTCCT